MVDHVVEHRPVIWTGEKGEAGGVQFLSGPGPSSDGATFSIFFSTLCCMIDAGKYKGEDARNIY
jgi:hypothetical protein